MSSCGKKVITDDIITVYNWKNKFKPVTQIENVTSTAIAMSSFSISKWLYYQTLGPQMLVTWKLTITCNSFSSIDTSEAPVDKAPLP